MADENTGENVKTLLHRRVNARLLLENDDRSDLEVIPLLRVTRAAGEDVGLPKRDPEFVGPCFILNGSATLRELVRDLSSQVLGSRQELVLQITRGGFSIDTMRGLQFEQVMRLRTLNRFGGRLGALIDGAQPGPLRYLSSNCGRSWGSSPRCIRTVIFMIPLRTSTTIPIRASANWLEKSVNCSEEASRRAS